jgi:hypothetical protein
MLPLWCASSGAAIEHVAVMQQPIEHRADSSNTSQQFALVFHRAVGCRVQGRWTPRWPVLDERVPNLLEVGRECQRLLNRSRQFRAECVRLVHSASVTSQAGRAQGLAVCFPRSRHPPPEDNTPCQSMSWISYFVGRFSGVHRWPVLGVPRGNA